MRWWRIFSPLLMAAFLVPSHARAFGMTGNKLLSECGTGPIESAAATWDTGVCLGYVTGILDTLTGIVICPSGGVTNGQAIDTAVRFVIDHPESRDREADVLVYQALTAAFPPCPKKTPTTAPQAGPNDQPFAAAGTAFFVSRDGMVLTNAHVIKGCTSFRVRELNGVTEDAALIAANEKSDLAVLQVRYRHAPGIARFRRGDAQLGESAFVFGYPLPGLLASSGNVTTGNVTALAGLGDDGTELQISAPVQPGNSGGAVLDFSGNVLGVVVGKLNARKIASIVEDIPQNVNFAIRGSEAIRFLDAHAIRYETASSSVILPTTALASSAQQFTAQVICTGQ